MDPGIVKPTGNRGFGAPGVPGRARSYPSRVVIQMNSQATDDEVPEALRQIAQNPRVLVRRGGAPAADGKCVVYWMQRTERALDNPALDVAVAVGNALDLPVLAFFSAISNFPHANLRHYAFLNQGLVDIEEDLQQRQIGFIVRRPPNNSLQTLLAEVDAAMVVGDENPCREPERWRKVLANRLRIPYWTVDADVVVPSGLFEKRDVCPAHLQTEALCRAAQIPRRTASGEATSGMEAESGVVSGAGGCHRGLDEARPQR